MSLGHVPTLLHHRPLALPLFFPSSTDPGPHNHVSLPPPCLASGLPQGVNGLSFHCHPLALPLVYPDSTDPGPRNNDVNIMSTYIKEG